MGGLTRCAFFCLSALSRPQKPNSLAVLGARWLRRAESVSRCILLGVHRITGTLCTIIASTKRATAEIDVVPVDHGWHDC